MLNLLCCCINHDETATLQRNCETPKACKHVSIIDTFVASFSGLTVREEILQGRGGHPVPVPRYTLRSVGQYSDMPWQGKQENQWTAAHHHLWQRQQSSARNQMVRWEHKIVTAVIHESKDSEPLQ